MAAEHSIGFDLGGTKMYAVVFDKNFKEIGSARVPTDGHKGQKDGLRRIAGTAADAIKSAGVKPKDICAFGIGCPGVVDFEKGILRGATNLGWGNVKVAAYLKEKLGFKATVLNDVDAGTYAEYAMGAGKKARSLLGIFPGTGVGGGFVYEGKILRGKAASCMEIGNLRLAGTTLEGRRDEPVRLEALAGRLGVAAACATEAARGGAPSVMEMAGTDIKAIKSGTIKKAIEVGEKAVEGIMRRSIDYLGLGAAAVVDLLAPDMIVLGGGLVEKMPTLYIDGLRSAIEANASAALAEGIEIKEAALGDHAVAMGAAAYALEQR
jgi:glucokinase